jgi:hypothetical protein
MHIKIITKLIVMKKSMSLRTRLYLGLVIAILNLTCTLSAKSQSFQLTTGTSTLLKEYPSTTTYYSIGYGTGNSTPTAKFHILTKNGIINDPLLKVEAQRSSSSEGYISFLGKVDRNGIPVSYGIFQSGDKLINSFEGPLIITGNLTFYHNINHLNGINILNDCYDDLFTFHFGKPNPNNSWSSPLILDVTNGVITHGTLYCDHFNMAPGAFVNAVLVSDQDGNATWTDPTVFHDDDWLPKAPKTGENIQTNLYLNEKYAYVGVGTQEPKSKFHVVDGNIMISRSPAKAPGSRNGSILFGKIIDETSPLGEWGIEYQDDLTTYMNGGLNFWKVYTELNPGKDHALFIRNDGFVGIGTASPQSELSVNGKITAKEIEVLAVGWVPDFVFEDDYKLKSLDEVEGYILSNKHLPDVPSAEEIMENGMNLSEMNSILLKKVEELTLYVIQLKKEIQQIKASKDEE